MSYHHVKWLALLDQLRTETAMEEQASSSTDQIYLRELRLRKEQQKLQKVTDKARDPRQDVSEFVNGLMHLGAAIGPRLRDGCPNWETGNSWTSHGGTMDLEHFDKSKVKLWESDESKRAVQGFDAIEPGTGHRTKTARAYHAW